MDGIFQHGAPESAASRTLARLLPLALVAAVLVVYGQAGSFPFLALDDDAFIRNNAALSGGLTWKGVGWAFTDTRTIGWLPLTWLSHLLDVTLFGWDPGGPHLVNVGLHAASAVLLFSALRRMTGRTAESGFVAALFALHPIHVESVAWLAERKDVLAGFFWTLSLRAYARYAERPGAGRYALLLAAFAAGLLSKPSVVTLPFLLLLLDWWPLGRLRTGPEGEGGRVPPAPPRRILLEKAPLVAMSATAVAVAFLSAREIGAMATLDGLPPWARIANAFRAYAFYLGKAAWPAELAILYPHPGIHVDPAECAAAALAVAAATGLAWRFGRERRWLLAGWLWFLGTMLPMLGLVQVGRHAYADRYAYLPLTGIYIVAVWGVSEAAGRIRHGRRAAFAAGLSVCLLAGAAAHRQAALWGDSVVLFEHALRVTHGNWLLQNSLGVELARRGRNAEAVERYREAIRINPEYAFAWFNLGMEMERAGRPGEAAAAYAEGLRFEPGDPDARARLVMLGGGPPP